jgi:hypothetical protein
VSRQIVQQAIERPAFLWQTNRATRDGNEFRDPHPAMTDQNASAVLQSLRSIIRTSSEQVPRCFCNELTSVFATERTSLRFRDGRMRLLCEDSVSRCVCPVPKDRIRGFRFSPDGLRIASGQGRSGSKKEIASGIALRRLTTRTRVDSRNSVRRTPSVHCQPLSQYDCEWLSGNDERVNIHSTKRVADTFSAAVLSWYYAGFPKFNKRQQWRPNGS